MASPEIKIPNYYSEPTQTNQPSPLVVLDNFAEGLPKQTGGLVEGKVYVAPFLGMTRYTFYLVIPTINDYNDPLFYVWNEKSQKDYPVKVLLTGSKEQEEVRCDEAAELTEQVNKIFNDSGTRLRIRQWIELAKERTSTATKAKKL